MNGVITSAAGDRNIFDPTRAIGESRYGGRCLHDLDDIIAVRTTGGVTTSICTGGAGADPCGGGA